MGRIVFFRLILLTLTLAASQGIARKNCIYFLNAARLAHTDSRLVLPSESKRIYIGMLGQTRRGDQIFVTGAYLLNSYSQLKNRLKEEGSGNTLWMGRFELENLQPNDAPGILTRIESEGEEIDQDEKAHLARRAIIFLHRNLPILLNADAIDLENNFDDLLKMTEEQVVDAIDKIRKDLKLLKLKHEFDPVLDRIDLLDENPWYRFSNNPSNLDAAWHRAELTVLENTKVAEAKALIETLFKGPLSYAQYQTLASTMEEAVQLLRGRNERDSANAISPYLAALKEGPLAKLTERYSDAQARATILDPNLANFKTISHALKILSDQGTHDQKEYFELEEWVDNHVLAGKDLTRRQYQELNELLKIVRQTVDSRNRRLIEVYLP